MHQLLVKHLAGETRAAERALAEQWIAASAENARYFDHLSRLWDAGQRLMYQNNVDENAAWDRFKKRVENVETNIPKQRIRFSWLKAAAVLLVLAAAAMVARRLIRHPETPVVPVHAKNHAAAVKKDSIINKPQPEKPLLKKHPAKQPVANKPQDLLLQPDTLQKLAHEPGTWPLLLERHPSPPEDLAIRRTIVGHLLGEMTTQQVIGQEPITSFRLNENEFFVNERRQPDSVHQWYKERYIRAAGFFIYFGGPRRTGQGVYLSRDSLDLPSVRTIRPTPGI